MKKQKLLTLLSITTISLSLFFTPLSVSANTLETNQDNIILAKSTSDPLIVLKGKSVTCGSKLDRLLALEYLNEKRTRPDFDDISISVRINGKTAELFNGAQVDLTEHDGEMIAIDYKYEDKVVKTLKLKVDCGSTGSTFEFIGEAKDGMIVIFYEKALKTLDFLEYVDIKALGGSENIDVKILALMTTENSKEVEENSNNKKTIGLAPKEINEINFDEDNVDVELPFYKIVYSLKNNPNVSKELLVLITDVWR